MDTTDWKDIQASLEGDGDAYKRLVRRYQSQITSQMWRFTRDRAECERLVQDVFVEAYFSLNRYAGRGPFANWLSKIAVRIGYRYWKQQAKQPKTVSVINSDAVAELSESAIDPAVAAEIVHRLLGQLPQADRLVLTLMYLEDCSTRDIAERMGWTRAMVKMRAYRARRKLRRIAEKERLLEKLGWTR